MPPISGKTVVVTGGNRGNGLEFVKQFLQKGNRVIAACRQPSQAQELQGLQGVDVTQLDVASPGSVADWAASVRKLVPHVDVVVNNAAVYGERITLDTVTSEDMLSVFTTNCIGPLLVVQQLRAAGLLGGAEPSLVANVTSKVGSVDDNRSGGGYAYRASKSALNVITKSMSIDLAGDNVTATLLHPGYVRTGMTSSQGLIDPPESVSGMIGVLESERELQGRWYDFNGKEVPW